MQHVYKEGSYKFKSTHATHYWLDGLVVQLGRKDVQSLYQAWLLMEEIPSRSPFCLPPGTGKPLDMRR